MLLERQFASGSLNVKNLTVETPRKEDELPFDPEGDWKGMKEQLEACRQSDRIGMFAELAAHMCMLFPKRRGELRIDQSIYQLFARSIGEKFQQLRFWRLGSGLEIDGLAHAGMLFKVLFPEKMADLRLGDRFWKQAKRLACAEFQGLLMLNHSQDLMMIFPDFDPLADNITREKIHEQLEHLISTHHRKREWDAYAQECQRKKLLFPHEEQIIDPTAWQGMKELLPRFRDPLNSVFLEYTLCLKTLAANEMKITDAGIEIIMPTKKENFEAPISPLPQVRNF